MSPSCWPLSGEAPSFCSALRMPRRLSLAHSSAGISSALFRVLFVPAFRRGFAGLRLRGRPCTGSDARHTHGASTCWCKSNHHDLRPLAMVGVAVSGPRGGDRPGGVRRRLESVVSRPGRYPVSAMEPSPPSLNWGGWEWTRCCPESRNRRRKENASAGRLPRTFGVSIMKMQLGYLALGDFKPLAPAR